MTELEPIPNLPLLRKVIDWAELDALKPLIAREWDQAEWVTHEAPCGTAYCIAGYAVHLTAGVGRECHVTADGRWLPDVAQQELGLNDDEARCLFIGNNSIKDVRRVAEDIAARAGERL